MKVWNWILSKCSTRVQRVQRERESRERERERESQERGDYRT